MAVRVDMFAIKDVSNGSVHSCTRLARGDTPQQVRRRLTGLPGFGLEAFALGRVVGRLALQGSQSHRQCFRRLGTHSGDRCRPHGIDTRAIRFASTFDAR